MKRSIALTVAVLLALTAGIELAHAGGKKKKTESWTATAPVPFPPETASCQNGPEGASVFNHEFATPGRGGILTVDMTGYVGDWDLWVFDPNGNALGQSTGFVDATSERVIVPIRGMKSVTVLSCNFLGGPTAELSATYVYTP